MTCGKFNKKDRNVRVNDQGGEREHQGRKASRMRHELNWWRSGLARSLKVEERITDLLPSKKSVKDETRVWQLVARQWVGLGHAAGVGITGRAEGGVHDIVAGTVGRAPGVFVAHFGERRMGEVILSRSGLTCGINHESA